VIAIAISSNMPVTTGTGNIVDFSSNMMPTPTLGGNCRVNIEVIPVEDYSDIVKLADLRYDEFITEESNTGTAFISKRSFRRGTAEIYKERTDEGATVFLATMIEDGATVAVGAAEASPIEFDQAIKVIDGVSLTNSAHTPPFLYVTDVVTCSKHRRMGVGNALMKAIEKEAAKRCHYYCSDDNNTNNGDKKTSFQNTRLFLNVKNDNDSASNFYKNPKLGYSEYNVSDNYHEENSVVQQEDKDEKRIKVYLNSHQLAKNADTDGQILLSKKIENFSFSGVKIREITVNNDSNNKESPTPLRSHDSNHEAPAWLSDGLEAEASTIIKDHQYFQEPQEKLVTKESIDDNSNNNAVAVANISIINELIHDTGAVDFEELLHLSEEELVVIINNILHYPILKQGKVLCHWLKAKEASKTTAYLF